MMYGVCVQKVQSALSRSKGFVYHNQKPIDTRRRDRLRMTSWIVSFRFVVFERSSSPLGRDNPGTSVLLNCNHCCLYSIYHQPKTAHDSDRIPGTNSLPEARLGESIACATAVPFREVGPGHWPVT